MDEGCANVQATQLSLLLPLDSQNIYSGPVMHATQVLLNQRFDSTAKVNWTYELDDGPKVNQAFEQDDGLKVNWTFDKEDGLRVNWTEYYDGLFEPTVKVPCTFE